MNQLSPDIKATITRFVYDMWNGNLEPSLLSGYDYRKVLVQEPSAAEQMVAILLNVLETTNDGEVTNAQHAIYRATEYLRSYLDPSYSPSPAFSEEETERTAYRFKSSGPMS